MTSGKTDAELALTIPLHLENRDEIRAVLKVREKGWSALTAREVQLCQQLLLRMGAAVLGESE
ncbi:MAG: hypothetical protein REI12_09625 [Pedobacter sp.]|nr:hypothetical protein [Pedobacter sp.]